jgi:hypothetical protein
MKSKSQFRQLPPEDQQRIIELCAQHPYEKAAEILARPRPEGLQLKTSKSALCRFNKVWSKEAEKIATLNQLATTLQIHRHESGAALQAGILSLVESYIFQKLSDGTPPAELKTDFAILKDLTKNFLAAEKFRRETGDNNSIFPDECDQFGQPDPEAHYDFVPLNPDGSQADIPPLSPSEIQDLTGPTGDERNRAKLDRDLSLYGPKGARDKNRMIPPALWEECLERYQKTLAATRRTPLEHSLHYRRCQLRPQKPAQKPSQNPAPNQPTAIPQIPPKST